MYFFHSFIMLAWSCYLLFAHRLFLRKMCSFTASSSGYADKWCQRHLEITSNDVNYAFVLYQS